MACQGPSPNLSWSELACKDPAKTPYPIEDRETKGKIIAVEFEAIREAAGGHPIRILSAYRTPEWNRTVGGAIRSWHVQALALDLKPPGEMTVHAFYVIIRRRAEKPGSLIRGIGIYPTFVHFDCRYSWAPNDRLVIWNGTRANADKEVG